MTQSVYIPMTPHARDALVSVCILWAVCVGVVVLRLAGRLRGAGISVDDALAFMALVC